MTRLLPLLVAPVLAGCAQGVPDTLDIVPGGETRLEALLETAMAGSDWENVEGGGGGSSDFVEYAYVFRTKKPVAGESFASLVEDLAELTEEMLLVNGAALTGYGSGATGFNKEYTFQQLRCRLRFVIAHEFDEKAMAHVTVNARR